MAQCSTTAVQTQVGGPLAQRAKLLAHFTIFYNLLEGIVSIGFGVREGSFALAGFGLDSLIEVCSALLVLWRLRSDFEYGAPLSVRAERKATFGVGVLFCLLAFVAAAAALSQLLRHERPESTVPGIVISSLSLSFMFFLWRAKRDIALAINSKTLAADAACSLACIQLSFVLLAGSFVFWANPDLWWVDAVATLVISGFVAREGYETIRAAGKADFQGGCGCH